LLLAFALLASSIAFIFSLLALAASCFSFLSASFFSLVRRIFSSLSLRAFSSASLILREYASSSNLSLLPLLLPLLLLPLACGGAAFGEAASAFGGGGTDGAGGFFLLGDLHFQNSIIEDMGKEG